MAELVTTSTPPTEITPAPYEISKEQRTRIAQSLNIGIKNANADRETLNANLIDWNDMYEMRVVQKDYPWPGASNVFVPLIPTMLDTLAAQLAQLVFAPRFFNVTGNDATAAKWANEVERYYNTELWRRNWVEQFYQVLQLGLRDGTAGLEILWRRTIRKRKVIQQNLVEDPDTGIQMVSLTDEDAPEEFVVQEMEVTEYDDVELTPVELRDMVIIPSWQTDINRANLFARAVYLDESDLYAMVASGDLYKDEVDDLLAHFNEGENELPEEEERTETYDLNEQIDLNEQEIVSDETVRMQRGPIKLWRVHTDLFDLDDDKIFEENVIWFHERYEQVLGVAPYEYWHGHRPVAILKPIPRPNRAYGFSLVERLRTIQTELNAIHNQINDQVNLRLSPPFYRKATAKLLTQNSKWGPGVEYQVQDKDDIGILQLPEINMSAVERENTLMQMAERLVGLGTPMQGMPSAGRKTAKEIQAANANSSVRMNLIAARVRSFAKETFFQIHELKKQFGPKGPPLEETPAMPPQMPGQMPGQPPQQPQQNPLAALMGGAGGAPPAPGGSSTSFPPGAGMEMQQVQQQQSLQPVDPLAISKIKLIQNYTLDITGNGGPLDKQQRFSQVMTMYTFLMQNPLVQSDGKKIYYLTRLVLEEMDRPDIITLIGTPEEAVQTFQAIQQAQQQQQLMEMMMGGKGKHPPQKKPKQRPKPGAPA